jgi:hypothetical protein
MISFALMKLPHGLNAAYERSPVVQQNLDEFRSLRGAFKMVDPGAYRGMERCPLSEVPEPDPGWIQATPPETLTNVDERARQRLLEILGPNHECEHYPCSLVPMLAQACELMRLVDRPEEYEIVRLSHGESSNAPLLGYDVGYWGGGNFSILCDSVIWPVWHGPVPEAFDELAQHIECLNAHALFPDHESADRFRSFYVKQSWAETEAVTGEFSVIRIEAAKEPPDALV